MVRVTLQLRVQSGREKEFEKIWDDIAVVVGKVPGNLRQALLRDARDRSCYIISSDWADAETFHAFERSQEQDELTAPIRRLRISGSMAIHDIVSTVVPTPMPSDTPMQFAG